MRKITVNMYMTFDGYAEFPRYPGSDYVPATADALFRSMWIDRFDDVDTVIYGRRSYLDHAAAHSSEARKPTDPEYLHVFSRFLDRSQKIVLSHRLKRTTWENSRILQGDLPRIVAKLRREPGKDIIVDSGPSVTQEFLKWGLADDYRISVWPVILGKGRTYWTQLPKQVTLKLDTVERLKYGELVYHYEAVRKRRT
jgi:dihydrofolate reductase